MAAGWQFCFRVKGVGFKAGHSPISCFNHRRINQAFVLLRVTKRFGQRLGFCPVWVAWFGDCSLVSGDCSFCAFVLLCRVCTLPALKMLSFHRRERTNELFDYCVATNHSVGTLIISPFLVSQRFHKLLYEYRQRGPRSAHSGSQEYIYIYIYMHICIISLVVCTARRRVAPPASGATSRSPITWRSTRLRNIVACRTGLYRGHA